MIRHRRRSVRLATVLLLVVVLAVLWYFGRQLRPSPITLPVSPSIDQGSLWEVGFTTPLTPATDSHPHRGGLDERLVMLMNRATKSIDVADYDFDLLNVANAMAGAAQRGLRVRMVTDTDTLENSRDSDIRSAFRTLRDAQVAIVPDVRQPIMHNKFTVIDGELVQTGSWNYTDGDTYHLNNNSAIFRSAQLAENYTAEFEKMFVGRVFGPSKPSGVPNPLITLGPLRMENYYSPQDGVADRLIPHINEAQTKIHFMAFSFTHDRLGESMMARRNAGVELQGVFETTGSNTQFSEFGKMKQAGAEVYQDGNAYVMHHKVILIDDRTTIFGSYNFSQNADRDNDENVLIVDDPSFTALYESEFQRVLATAKNKSGPKQPGTDRTDRQR